MLRRLSYLLLLLSLFLVSCSRETEESSWDGPYIELDLTCDESMQTKADDDSDDGSYTQSGENPYRENRLSRVDFFFYPGGDTLRPASYHIPKVLDQLTRSNASFRLELTSNQVNYLIFPVHSEKGNICTVFALVNAPQSILDVIEDLENTSLDNLKSLLVTTDFESPGNEFHLQQNFMMSGKADIELRGRDKKMVAKHTIDLSRYACKLTVGILAYDKVELDTGRKDGDEKIYEVWEPCVTEMKIYLEDGVKTVSLGGNPAGTLGGAPAAQTQTLSYRGNPLYFFDNVGTLAQPVYEQIFDKTGEYYNTYPMYMYPQHWEDGVSEGITKEPYLKLVLPWERRAGKGISSTKKEFYYKILIPKDRRNDKEKYQNNFVRNNWYHYNIKVGMLGADTEDAAVEVNPIDFYIYHWQDKNMVVKYASIGNARYLSVEKDEYILHNEESVDVRYTSSHPVSLNLESVTRPYYGTVAPGNRIDDLGATVYRSNGEHPETDALYPAGSNYLFYDETVYSSWFEDHGTYIRMTHPINNDYSSATFDYSAYTMIFNVHHQDGGVGKDYAKDVKIVQYPAIFIDAEENSDPRVENPQGGDDTVENNKKSWMNFAHNGYVFVDGKRRMRNKTQNDGLGEYGVMARELQDLIGTPAWREDSSDPPGPYRTLLEWLQWRIVNFTGGNRNMYNISVSVLEEKADGNNFVIGDPRTLTPVLFLDQDGNQGRQYGYMGGGLDPDTGEPAIGHIDLTTAISMSDFLAATNQGKVDEVENLDEVLAALPKRGLQFYYPVDEADRTKNMLAPSLRFASKFGGLEYYNGVTKESAIYKCATYQEDGYPAGRWRLPTQAEINFIAMLSKTGTFITLFHASSFYWCANGALQPGATQAVTKDYALARCVYDSWYWDQFDNGLDRLPQGARDYYVFGDIER